jgi:hypothetical protein
MNRVVSRTLAALFATTAASLALACGAAPEESTQATAESLITCPVGETKDCEQVGTKNMCGPCYAIDGDNAIAAVSKAPALATNTTGESLDVGPYPYPPQLAQMGCTKTAKYHASKNDTTGGRIWYCPTNQLTPPWSMESQPWFLFTGTTINSAVLGSPQPGWTIFAESLTSSVPTACLPTSPFCDHKCSGACNATGGVTIEPAPDNTYAITALAQAPTGSGSARLDVSPQPYPPELAGMGCTQTARYYSSPQDTLGGRVWFCPQAQLVKPAHIQPIFFNTLQGLIVGTIISSNALGSPPPGWVALVEYLDRLPLDVINHGCSGGCIEG